MVTRLANVLKREIDIDGEPYIVHITETCLRLVRKGRRKGYELAWKDLVSGEAALATALAASLRNGPSGPARAERPSKRTNAPPEAELPTTKRRRE